jgi:hypothetical protein
LEQREQILERRKNIKAKAIQLRRRLYLLEKLNI